MPRSVAPGRPPDGVTIRPLEWRDFEELVAIYYAAYDERDRGEPIGITLFPDRPSRADEVGWFAALYRRVLAEEALVVVAEERGRLVGSCTIGPVGPLRRSETGHVGELGILVGEGARGRGVGEALMRQALDLARERFEQVRLTVFSDNDRAIRLYSRLGFVVCGRVERGIKRGSRYVDEVFMVLDFARGAAPAKG